MNCNDLEEIVSDLAAARIMDESLRALAQAHTESCAYCAARLSDERALTAGLRGVAAATASSSSGEAPARVESALLAAFRELHSAEPAPVFAAARYSARRWAYIAVGGAAAAVLAMLLLLGVSRSVSQPPVPENAGGSSPALPPTHEDRTAIKERPASSESEGLKLSADKSTSRRNGAPAAAGHSVRLNGRTNKPAGKADDSTGEIATDFIPLMNRDSLGQLDSGQVMRVELPRSALMSFGLPMNMERANERIKADVIVGNDGLARAIRFVR